MSNDSVFSWSRHLPTPRPSINRDPHTPRPSRIRFMLLATQLCRFPTFQRCEHKFVEVPLLVLSQSVTNSIHEFKTRVLNVLTSSSPWLRAALMVKLSPCRVLLTRMIDSVQLTWIMEPLACRMLRHRTWHHHRCRAFLWRMSMTVQRLHPLS